MTRRQTSAEERAQFETAFKEARAIKRDALDGAAASKPTKRPSPTAGLDGNTQERLRKGQLDPDARIDLHGMTEEVAHARLLAFLTSAQRGGARLSLVITGKSGVLKTAVPRWLAEPDCRGLIADTRSAHRRHGGSGALYVYLRKRLR